MYSPSRPISPPISTPIGPDYADFHLRVEAKLDSASGEANINFRASFGPVLPHNFTILLSVSNPASHPAGYLAGFYDSEMGGLYIDGDPVLRRDRVPQVKPSEWTTYEVIAQDDHLVIKVNGETTCDCIDLDHRHAKGHIALEAQAGAVVEFRNIEIKKLTPANKQRASVGGAGDPVAANSVWVNKEEKMTLTVLERKGETFRAMWDDGPTIKREVNGTIKDGKLFWLAKDVRAVKGGAGLDNYGTLAKDQGGDLLDFVYRRGNEPNAGAFKLHLKADK